MSFRLPIAVLAFTCLGTTAASSKAPEAPTIPQTEFKVLPALAQEFFQPESAPSQNPFVAVAETAPSVGVFGAVGGAGLEFALTRRQPLDWLAVLSSDARPYRNIRGGFHSFGSSWSATEPIVARMTIDFQKWGMAREVLAMAEVFRRDRNWSEADRWYAGVRKLWPRSPYATLAAKRQESLALVRILNEAGEEQSEEPPLAGPEKLKVMPREVPSRLPRQWVFPILQWEIHRPIEPMRFIDG